MVIYLIYMALRYDGHCLVWGWPGLSQGGIRSCSFSEYVSTSLETPFWPYTMWQALAGCVLLTIIGPGMVGYLIDRWRRDWQGVKHRWDFLCSSSGLEKLKGTAGTTEESLNLCTDNALYITLDYLLITCANSITRVLPFYFEERSRAEIWEDNWMSQSSLSTSTSKANKRGTGRWCRQLFAPKTSVRDSLLHRHRFYRDDDRMSSWV